MLPPWVSLGALPTRPLRLMSFHSRSPALTGPMTLVGDSPKAGVFQLEGHKVLRRTLSRGPTPQTQGPETPSQEAVLRPEGDAEPK